MRSNGIVFVNVPLADLYGADKVGGGQLVSDGDACTTATTTTITEYCYYYGVHTSTAATAKYSVLLVLLRGCVGVPLTPRRLFTLF